MVRNAPAARRFVGLPPDRSKHRQQGGLRVELETINRNYEPSNRVLTTIEERADRFTKYVQDHMQVRFTLTAERVEYVCEIHVHVKGKDFHTRTNSEDMLVSVDKACASMEEQLRRHKAKRKDHKIRSKRPGVTSAAALEATFNEPTEPGLEEEES
jgi:ribosomal subunit interface protein